MSSNLIEKICTNSWLFLNRAIKELINHDDSNDDALIEENAIMAVTLIQMSFELSLVSNFLRTRGIHSIVRGDDCSLTEEELLSKYEENKLVTKSFNSLKETALKEHVFLTNDDDEALIDEFQKIRNKLIHLNYSFNENDLYDIKYNLIYFIVKLLIPTLGEDETKTSESIAANIEKEDFLKLIQFPPYVAEMHKVAKENAENVFQCIHCDNDTLAVELDGYCYSCCAEFYQEHVGFIDCPHCKSKHSVIYDALNIDCQKDRTARAVCLSCHEDDLVYVCKDCSAEILMEASVGEKVCYSGFCQWK